jgi:hypothetical protein
MFWHLDVKPARLAGGGRLNLADAGTDFDIHAWLLVAA